MTMVYELRNAIDTQATEKTVVAQLLSEALALLEHDHSMARRRIEHAFTLAKTEDSDAPQQKSMLPKWRRRRAIDYIRSNLGSKLRVDDVAEAAALSASYFARSFKATMGMSYSKYVCQARVDMAMHLLLTTDTSIVEIALTCGLADQSHLTRVFRKLVGLPPKAWRQQMRDKAQDIQLDWNKPTMEAA
jgi:AraC family transcriptional regulator